MTTFTLPNGKTAEKDALYCVALQRNGRWTHKFYKDWGKANNELKFWRNCSQDTRDYYGVDAVRFVKANAA